MRLFNILILIFVLAAFAIGSTLQSEDMNIIHESLDNASIIVQNITLQYPTLDYSQSQYMDGGYKILEKAMHFFGVAYVEVMRMGIVFGSENPEYFEPSYIMKIIKMLIYFALISLLIKPVFYLIVFIIMVVIWVTDKIKAKNKEKLEWIFSKEL